MSEPLSAAELQLEREASLARQGAREIERDRELQRSRNGRPVRWGRRQFNELRVGRGSSGRGKRAEDDAYLPPREWDRQYTGRGGGR